MGEHPKIFVSRGTHGNYLKPGPQSQALHARRHRLEPGYLAQIEKLDDVIAGGEEIPGPKAKMRCLVVLLKFGVNLFVGMFLGSGRGLRAHSAGVRSRDRPEPKAAGRNRRPALRIDPAAGGPVCAGAGSAQRTEDWQTKMPEPTDKPRYDFIVDRETQLWWPPRGQPRLCRALGSARHQRSQTRRSGMRCPPFGLLFLEGIATL